MKTYNDYPLHHRINRKSYFGTDSYKMKTLIHCINNADIFMHPPCLDTPSPKIYLNGERVNVDADIVYYKLMPHGTTLKHYTPKTH